MNKDVLSAVILVFAAVVPAKAQADFFNAVRYTLNSPDGTYAKGDTVKIFANLVEPVDGPLEMKIYENGSRRHYRAVNQDPEKRPVVLSEQPTLVYSGVFNETHTAIISIAPAGNTKKSAQIGFGVAMEEYRPGYDVPEDFVSYWSAQKKALRKSKMKVKRTPVDSGDENTDAWAIELSMPEGNPVRGYMAMPKNAARASLPVVLLLHSAGVERKGCPSNLRNAVKFSKYGSGAIAIDFNAHGMLDAQPQSYYDGLAAGELKNYAGRPLTSRDDFYFRLMFLRELRVLDYACALPEWDKERVAVSGGSQGGGQALAIAGLDPRVKLACVRAPALTDFGGGTRNRQSGWPTGYEKVCATELARDILPYFDGAIFAQFTKARVLMSAGFIDETCHAACVYAAFNACASSDKRIFVSPFRYHTGTAKPYRDFYKFDKVCAQELNDYLK